MNLKQKAEQFAQQLRKYRHHVLPIVLGAAGVSLFQFAVNSWQAGWGSWAAALPALVVILITCLARLDDIGLDKKEAIWHVRRIGLVLTGLGCIYLLMGPFTDRPIFPTWIGTMMAWGIAFTWFSTPAMPPWWKYITGEFRKKSNGDPIV